ncbi:MAG: hypothetical protein ACYSRR_05020, partial [Planctomycetota bacterium]
MSLKISPMQQPGSNVIVQVAMADPASHVVDNGGSLGTGTGTVSAAGGKVILAAGDIFSTAIAGVATLRAEAERDITLEGSINASSDVDLLADRNVKIKDDVTTGGDFTSSGVDFDNTGGIITTGGGDIAINHTGTTTLGADLDSGGGSMSGTSTSIEVASNAAEIQDAIDIAPTSTTITVSADTYTENLIVDKSDMSLKSKLGDAVTLTANSGLVVDLRSGSDGFTLGGA